METQETFLHIMAEQTEIALATSVDNMPDVRIVNFYFDPDDNLLYFTTFKDNNKVAEIRANGHVAFTTVPHTGNAHVKAQGVARPSNRAIKDIADRFDAKIPGYAETLQYGGDDMLLYEIGFETATVTQDLEHIDTLTIR
ncbi:pyridoxamine 5'-phosphate oxidase family protein [Bifidobacterium sp. ESL0704]|uniref:pyridoxamine 5'-phosphate oxidase family protein n=1 Tax=Bifidobacterium sp. ESL0704 TaxID=2983219 RepID=UPI0023F84BF9|nr:pyridoxamine 5'-phosphate oxidase family protein [Bifidobacterium sp. ESL0704]WEV53024.1 pyridoxamine 5'-phosphate oxidase family protein [Bifidobacterium sp. ESL0704]